MKKLVQALKSTLLGLVLSSLAGGAASLRAEDTPWKPKASKRGAYDTQSVIVKFRWNAQKQERHGLAALLNGKFRDKHQRGIDDRFDRIANGQLALIELDGRKGVDAATEALAVLRKHPAVEYAAYNHTQNADNTPNDPRLGELWGMNNTGQSGGRVGADIRALSAWDITTGSSEVVVGIIDTGLDYTHQDLAANAWTNPQEIAGNGIDDDGNGYVDDVHGINAITGSGNPMDDNEHGSHCAGTIGGSGNNGLGVAGVNWKVKLIGLKFLDSAGSGTTADAIECINYAIALKQGGVNLRVLSNSWGGGAFEQALLDAITAAGNVGILFVAAAGNAGTNNDVSPHYPSSYNAPNVLAVASTDRYDAMSSFSCYGATSVDLGAPGSEILSTVPGNAYAVFSGTSMATPHVSGAAALLLSANNTLSVADMKSLLMNSGDAITALSGKTVSGRRLNILSALQQVPPATPSFTLATTPTSQVINQGDSATFTIAVGSAMGFSGSVNLSASSLPVLDAQIAFSLNPAPAGGNSMLTIAASTATAVGDYLLTVTGVSDSITKTTTISLKVRPFGTVERTYANTTPLSIPDNAPAGVISTLEVSDAITIDATSVAVHLTHTYIGDLIVKLTSPAGTETILHNRTGSSTDNLYTTYNPAVFKGQSGTGRWTLFVSDNAGIDTGTLDNWSLTLTGTINGTPVNQAPTVTITAPANGVTFYQGDAVTFTGSASDPENGSLSGSIHWTSDLSGSLGTGASLTITSLALGSHTITASVTDSGSITTTKTLTITVIVKPTNKPPTANFTYTSSRKKGYFTDASNDSDGTVAAWSWSFGDGGTSTLKNPTRTYARVGTYSVTLKVTDNAGATATVTKSVTILK